MPLTGRVAHEALHRVHVRAIFQQRHGDALHAQHREHVKVPVVARDRAEELEAGNVPPWRVARQRAVEYGANERVVDEVDAGIAADDHLLGRHPKQRAEQALCLGNAGGVAVVAHVHAVLAEKARVGRAQHGQGKVELPGVRLAARHVQSQSPRAECLVLPLNGGVRTHCNSPRIAYNIYVYYRSRRRTCQSFRSTRTHTRATCSTNRARWAARSTSPFPAARRSLWRRCALRMSTACR